MYTTNQIKIEEAYAKMNEANDGFYSTHGGLMTKVKPDAIDAKSWIDHGSFRNRPLILTKDTPTTLADDTKMAAKMTADAVLTATPITGAGAVKAAGAAAKVIGNGLKPAASAALKTAATGSKALGTAAAKGAVSVGKKVGTAAANGAAAVGKKVAKGAAVIGAGKVGIDYAANKIANAAKKAVDAGKEAAKDLGKKAADYAGKAVGLAKAHPYAAAAVAAAPLAIYGAKKAWDYFKSKNPDRKEESCDESTAPMYESMFNRMIDEMEYLGYLFIGADDNDIKFEKDGSEKSFSSWDDVEKELDMGSHNANLAVNENEQEK